MRIASTVLRFGRNTPPSLRPLSCRPASTIQNLSGLTDSLAISYIPAIGYPLRTPCFTAPSREEAKFFLSSVPADSCIFTDGSVGAAGAGASAVTQSADGANYYFKQCKLASSTGCVTSLDAEIAGMILAVEMALANTSSRRLLFNLCVDCQSAINLVSSLELDQDRPGITMAKTFRNVHDVLAKERPNIRIHILWVPAHESTERVRGNDVADAHAKAAANGRMLPTSLHHSICTSVLTPLFGGKVLAGQAPDPVSFSPCV